MESWRQAGSEGLRRATRAVPASGIGPFPSWVSRRSAGSEARLRTTRLPALFSAFPRSPRGGRRWDGAEGVTAPGWGVSYYLDKPRIKTRKGGINPRERYPLRDCFPRRCPPHNSAMQPSPPPLPEGIARAVARGDPVPFVEWLDSGQGDVNSRDAKGRTTLMLAVAVGNRATVQTLIERGADLELKQAQGTTALMFACYSGDVTLTRTLIAARANLDASDNRGLAAQDYAQLKDHTAITLLLRHHQALRESTHEPRPQSPPPPGSPVPPHAAPPQAAAPSKPLPVHCGPAGSYPACGGGPASSSTASCSSSASTSVLGSLCSSAAASTSASAETSLERSPLLPQRMLEAAQNNDLHAVRAYIEEGRPVDAIDTQLGGTMLTCAAASGHLEMMDLLLSAGATVDVRDANGCTALGAACFALEEGAVQRLIDARANVDNADNVGLTALMLASLAGKLSVVKLLLSVGARKESRDANQHTALMYAQAKGHQAVVMALQRARLASSIREPRLTPEELEIRTKAANEAADALMRAQDEQRLLHAAGLAQSSRTHAAAPRHTLAGTRSFRSSASTSSNRRKKNRTNTAPAAFSTPGQPLASAPSPSASVSATSSASISSNASPAPFQAAPPSILAMPVAGWGARLTADDPSSSTASHAEQAVAAEAIAAEAVAEAAAGVESMAVEEAPSTQHAVLAGLHAAVGAAPSAAMDVAPVDLTDAAAAHTSGIAPPAAAMAASIAAASIAAANELPEAYCCPITQLLMIDPVVTCDGYTYERTAIVQWLERRSTSPLTGAPLAHTNLVSNGMARSLIREFAEAHPQVAECQEFLIRLASIREAAA